MTPPAPPLPHKNLIDRQFASLLDTASFSLYKKNHLQVYAFVCYPSAGYFICNSVYLKKVFCGSQAAELSLVCDKINKAEYSYNKPCRLH